MRSQSQVWRGIGTDAIVQWNIRQVGCRMNRYFEDDSVPGAAVILPDDMIIDSIGCEPGIIDHMVDDGVG